MTDLSLPRLFSQFARFMCGFIGLKASIYALYVRKRAMSAADTHHGLVRNARAGFVSKMIDSVVAWNDARVTRNALAALSDRELNDIGLTRYDIDALIR